VAIVVPAITRYGMVNGFIFLRDGDAPKYVISLVAIIWGVGGVALIYYITNWLIENFPLNGWHVNNAR
jgi:alpha-glucoside transport system permease protein